MTVTGNIDIGANDFNVDDNGQIHIGSSADLKLFHDGSNSYIQDAGTGILVVATNRLHVNNAANDENMIRAFEDGQVELYYDNTKHFETTANGVQVSAGRLDVGSVSLSGGGLALADSDKVKCGNGDDLQIYHNPNGYNYIFADNNGLVINSNTLYLKNEADSADLARLHNGGSVQLFHDNVNKIETTATGASVTGYVTQSALPSACVYGVAGWTTISASNAIHPLAIFSNAAHNTGSMYSNSTGKMTAPVAGVYHILINLFCMGATSSTSTSNSLEIYIKINGNTISRHHNKIGYGNLGDNQQVMSLNCVEDLSANDEVTIYIGAAGGGNWQIYGSHSNFQMTLIG